MKRTFVLLRLSCTHSCIFFSLLIFENLDFFRYFFSIMILTNKNFSNFFSTRSRSTFSTKSRSTCACLPVSQPQNCFSPKINKYIAKLSSSWKFCRNLTELALLLIITAPTAPPYTLPPQPTHPPPPGRYQTKP